MPNVLQLKHLVHLLLGLVVTGLLIAVYLLWNQQSQLEQSIADLKTASTTNTTANEVATNILTEEENLSLLQASMSALSSTVNHLDEQLTDLSKQIANRSSSNNSSLFPSFTKETLYLGSASTSNREWSETGLELGINSAHYPAGVTVKLEASLSIIGGEAWVRLKNKSTGAVISLSEIFHNTNVATWKLSPSFALHSGGYTYVLEARSTSGETANISGARLIIEK